MNKAGATQLLNTFTPFLLSARQKVRSFASVSVGLNAYAWVNDLPDEACWPSTPDLSLNASSIAMKLRNASRLTSFYGV
jgi:hypothetical protein